MNLEEFKEMMNAGGRYDVTFEAGGKLVSAYPVPEGYRYAAPEALLEILLQAGYKITPSDV